VKTYRLEREQIVNSPVRETFAFFANPKNLDALTPGFLRFRFVGEPPATLTAGAVLHYRIRLYGVPVDWQSRIEVWEPPACFVDLELRGPYSMWRHTHTFEDAGGGRTLVKDSVEFALPMGPLGTIAYYLFVARSLERIFDFRAERMRVLMG
jgi:ligand-binding SRPBCC domain-containing protein